MMHPASTVTRRGGASAARSPEAKLRPRAAVRPRAAPGVPGRPGRALSLAALLAAAAAWLGCGGGSPSDIVPPGAVDVTLVLLDEPVPRSVQLELASAEGLDVTLRVVGAELEDATGVAFELEYDPALLEFRGAEPGGLFGPGAAVGAGIVQGAPGRLVGVSARADQTQGLSGSGAVATLNFRLKQLRDSESTLIFGVPESLVYGPAGVAGQHAFLTARLVTRIRPPT